MKLLHKGFNGKTRTENVIKNVRVAMICHVANIILGFISRAYFVYLLGTTYLGINGIFSNILTILNFAELGIGTAIVYNLYKPLHDKDEKAVCSLVNFYRKAYWAIGSFIFIAGMLLIPFLSVLIKEQPNIKENIVILYLLYLSSTVITYFNAHKKSLLIADQNQYITSIVNQTGKIIQTVLQLIFLLCTKNYIIYLIIQILCCLIENIIISIVTDKIYPFLKNDRKSIIRKDEIRGIRKDVSALFIYKINSAIIHGSDNIIISAIVPNGVQAVGLYSNYVMITDALNSLLGIVTNALTPSIGNLNVETNLEKKESVFYTTLFICAWLYGFACSGIMALSRNFISLWLGGDLILSNCIVFSIVLQLYIRSVHYAAYTYRVTCGLFVQSKYVPILTSVINIGLSIILGKKYGLFGILFATSIARIITIGISDPFLVYKYVLHKKLFLYYAHYFFYTIVVLISFAAASIAISKITIGGWGGFFICAIIFSITFNLMFAFLTFKSRQFQYVFGVFINYINKIKHITKKYMK